MFEVKRIPFSSIRYSSSSTLSSSYRLSSGYQNFQLNPFFLGLSILPPFSGDVADSCCTPAPTSTWPSVLIQFPEATHFFCALELDSDAASSCSRPSLNLNIRSQVPAGISRSSSWCETTTKAVCLDVNTGFSWSCPSFSSPAAASEVVSYNAFEVK